MMPTIVVDDGCGVLSPLTDVRGAMFVRTGVMTTLERVATRLEVRAVWVPEALAALTREATGLVVNEVPADLVGQRVVVLNGRCGLVHRCAGLVKDVDDVVVDAGGAVLAAVVEGSRVAEFVRQMREGKGPNGSVAAPPGVVAMTRPWHVRSGRDACVLEDLEVLTAKAERFFGTSLPVGAIRIGSGKLAVHASATVLPGAIVDTTGGAILIDEGAVVRPGAIVIGPCAVLAHATVLERATIRPFTVVGPWCKVNGEVGGTIFQGYSNKAHDGYLGDSYVGEWVNLGAGTTNSNLLNTYGEVVSKATPDGRNERTGETFFGAIIGDHVKAAICTRIMTGSVIGTGAMLATTAATSGCVPAFTWNTDEGRRAYRVDKFVEVMRAAMGRRRITPGAAYLARIEELCRSASGGSGGALGGDAGAGG
jgi:UDP-N-acetylglucosamine diphosphorylase / glucose-1-phosphate thymidylyltransferase / UDP-N-acetylgalactosamine diphosphorylase / glucosamine-1-phosphate N-acetyltransferase / galactosamine-1-phosphate N-acetyltransferase